MSDTTLQSTRPVTAFVDARDDRNRALAHIFKTGELAWVLEERYEAPTSSWTIVLMRSGPQARWMRQRYRYDSAVDVLFFLGERPLSDEEAAQARSTGKLLKT